MARREAAALGLAGRRERELEALHAIAAKVAAAKSVPAIGRSAAAAAVRLLGYGGAAVLLLAGDPGAETLELAARAGAVPRELLGGLGDRPGPRERAALKGARNVATAGGRAAALVPIVAGKRRFGLLVVAAGPGAPLDRRAGKVLAEVCRAIGTALESRRLLDVARRRIEDIRFFRDVSAWIGGTIDLDRLLARICDHLSKLVDVPQCFICLHDAESRALYAIAATAPYMKFIPGIRVATSTRRSIAVRAFKTRRPFAVYDAANDPRANARLVRMFKETSLLAIPLVVRGEAFGAVMLAETRRLRRFSEEEIARAQTVVNQAALAIENALRHRDAVAARDRAELLLETGHDCSSSLDVNEIMRRIARRTVAMTSAHRCAFWMPDESGRILRLVDYGLTPRLRAIYMGLIGRSISEFAAGRAVLAGRRPVVYADIGKERGLPPALAKAMELRAVVLAPVRARGRFLAALGASYPPGVRAVPPEEVELIGGIADQVALAIENAKSFDEIGRQRLALDVLTSRMLGAQEEERRRLARELHDGVSQTLTAVKLELERLGRRPGAGDEVRRAAQTLGEAIGEVRRLCMDLRPSQLDHLGLLATLEWFAKTFERRAGIAVALDLPADGLSLTPDQEINLYRIAQEALNNVAKHARARRATLRLRVRPRRVEMTIADDGQGFDPGGVERSHADERGMGLLTMSERAHLLGGEVRVRSRAGQGTIVDVTVPIKTRPARAPGSASAPVPVPVSVPGSPPAPPEA